jgi:MFS family permease
MRPVDALRFVMDFFGGIAAGGLVSVTIYALALKELPPELRGRIHSRFHPLTHRTMQTSTIIAAVAAIAVGILDDPGWHAYTILAFVGVLGVLPQAIISRFWLVPMSDDMIEWERTGVPPDHERFLRSWTLLHCGRVVGAVGAFVCYLLSTLLR